MADGSVPDGSRPWRPSSAPRPARCTAEDWNGNWKRPSAFWSPPFGLKWLAITITRRSRNSNSPASGLRLVLQTGFVGSTRPGDSVSDGSPLRLTIAVPVVERSTPAAPRSTNDTRAGLNRNTTRMLPPGWPPSWSSTGSISRQS